MNDSHSYPLAPSQFNAAQRKALDRIGLALKQRRIDFKTAATLSSFVKDGRVAEALKRLDN